MYMELKEGGVKKTVWWSFYKITPHTPSSMPTFLVPSYLHSCLPTAHAYADMDIHTQKACLGSCPVTVIPVYVRERVERGKKRTAWRDRGELGKI